MRSRVEIEQAISLFTQQSQQDASVSSMIAHFIAEALEWSLGNNEDFSSLVEGLRALQEATDIDEFLDEAEKVFARVLNPKK